MICPHNRSVDCEARKCANCGWNPTVQKTRITALKKKLAEEQYESVVLPEDSTEVWQYSVKM